MVSELTALLLESICLFKNKITTVLGLRDNLGKCLPRRPEDLTHRIDVKSQVQ